MSKNVQSPEFALLHVLRVTCGPFAGDKVNSAGE